MPHWLLSWSIHCWKEVDWNRQRSHQEVYQWWLERACLHTFEGLSGKSCFQQIVSIPLPCSCQAGWHQCSLEVQFGNLRFGCSTFAAEHRQLPFDLALAGHLPVRLRPCLALNRPFVISCLLVCCHIMTIDPCCFTLEHSGFGLDADLRPCCCTLCLLDRHLCLCNYSFLCCWSCLCFHLHLFGCSCSLWFTVSDNFLGCRNSYCFLSWQDRPIVANWHSSSRLSPRSSQPLIAKSRPW